ncbi:MAG: universal stress protein [Flavobacteriales bacterium]|nr:universal stress protein [Flavobacteriales bacterium]
MGHPPIRHIFHPTDLSPSSITAFLHALRIALVTRSVLTIMHVADGEDLEPGELPGVRSTLKRWGLIDNEEDKTQLVDLGLGVRKVVVQGDGDPAESCLEYLDRHAADLIVLSTHQRSGRMSWLERKVAEPLARGAAEPTLFIPHDRAGFVEPRKGEVTIRKILIPVDHAPDPAPAIRAAARVADQLVVEDVEFVLLHVGGPGTGPKPTTPERNGWSWRTEERTGDVVTTILQVEQAIGPDLIVMTTEGHHGFLDALRGSTTERVLRGARCPVLTGIAP